ncbi:MAG: hypothetical protein SVX43_22850, partial [Cyanobacteriota bacterium]|nr:hypothetical protein [Cyanobacteriota bacterium]
MFDEPELFWLGILLWLGVTVWLLAQRGANSKPQPEPSLLETEKPPTPDATDEIERLREQCRHLKEELERQSALSGLSETEKPPTTEAADEIEQLQAQCRRLREELERQSAQLYDDFRAETFAQLQSLLVSLPTARCMARAKPSWPAKNLVSLFSPLEQLRQSWGYDCIGEVWEQVPYDPQLHQPDADDIASGELVYVRFVGYRNGDRI